MNSNLPKSETVELTMVASFPIEDSCYNKAIKNLNVKDHYDSVRLFDDMFKNFLEIFLMSATGKRTLDVPKNEIDLDLDNEVFISGVDYVAAGTMPCVIDVMLDAVFAEAISGANNISKREILKLSISKRFVKIYSSNNLDEFLTLANIFCTREVQNEIFIRIKSVRELISHIELNAWDSILDLV